MSNLDFQLRLASALGLEDWGILGISQKDIRSHCVSIRLTY